MSPNGSQTVSFKWEHSEEDQVQGIMTAVYAALEEKGYNAVNQIVGYMISGDPAYITSHNEARSLICKVDRDVIMEVLLKKYLGTK
ncbi:MAG: IreB family regulatory phosphoprotein [Syntrophomonadaceae bacterium]|nr:IreB family regulatory phosphoprotein [Syntrophomonadaceae bacterium]